MPYIKRMAPPRRGAAGEAGRDQEKGGQEMGRIVKVVLVLAVLGAIGLTGYAYLGISPPMPQETRKPVELNAAN